MPVSSPSYFPPVRGTGTVVGTNAGTTTVGSRNFLSGKDAGKDSTANDLLIMGYLAGTGNDGANPFLTGTGADEWIILGNNAVNADDGTDPNALGSIVVGFNALKLFKHAGGNNAGSSVVIGNKALASLVSAGGASQIVVIGQNAANLNTQGITNSVVLGYNAVGATSDSLSVNNLSAATVIGFEAMAGGGAAINAYPSKVTCIGAGALVNWTNCSTLADCVFIGNDVAPDLKPTAPSANVTLIGSGCGNSATFVNPGVLNDVTVLGANSLKAPSTRLSRFILIGVGSGNNLSQGFGHIVIGNAAATNLNSAIDAQAVIIGHGAAMAMTTGSSQVIIGDSAATAMTIDDSSVIIGTGAATALNGSSGNVFIGNAVAPTPTTAAGSIAIGAGCDMPAALSNSIVIGTVAGFTAAGQGSIVIGDHAGRDIDINVAFPVFFIGTGGAGGTYASGAMFFGDLSKGNLVIGNSIANQREFAGVGATNILKLIAGTKGSTNPVNGGYFYVDASANNVDQPVHWVNASGGDFAIGPSGPAFMGTGDGQISPAALPAGATNDYAPAGFAQCQVVRLSGDAGGSTLNGLAGGAAGRLVELINVSANTIALANAAAGSLAANRFSLPGAANLNLTQFSSILLRYDGTLANWVSAARSN